MGRPYPAFLPSFCCGWESSSDQGRQMPEIAARYDRLAERAEERLRSESGSPISPRPRAGSYLRLPAPHRSVGVVPSIPRSPLGFALSVRSTMRVVRRLSECVSCVSPITGQRRRARAVLLSCSVTAAWRRLAACPGPTCHRARCRGRAHSYRSRARRAAGNAAEPMMVNPWNSCSADRSAPRNPT